MSATSYLPTHVQKYMNPIQNFMLICVVDSNNTKSHKLKAVFNYDEDDVFNPVQSFSNNVLDSGSAIFKIRLDFLKRTFT